MNSVSGANKKPELVLASSSPYRQAQLQQLGLHFRSVSPHINEAALADESAESLALRLARQKALAVARQLEGPALVIGSDQTAECQGKQLGKPGNEERAIQQLNLCSGEIARFYTAISVQRVAGAQIQQAKTACTLTEVKFRQLSAEDIASYIAREQPFDCAGSFKCEGLGIALFEHIRSDDPSALIGLPLIQLCTLLQAFNYSLLSRAPL